MVNDRQRLSTVDENLQVLGRLGGGGGRAYARLWGLI